MTDPIRARIIELIPEIVELEFGCRVRSGTGTYKLVNSGYDQEREEKWHTYLADFDDLIVGDLIADEILGRPITLADILRAIEMQYQLNGLTSKDEWGVSIGNYWVASLLDPEQKTRWNMALDYDNQSQPTKDFIGELLNVTE